jgi:bifunctional non-homologous end joining protein LigD
VVIRKNTKAFKTIQQIVAACKDRPDRHKLIRLYITKGGHSIQDRMAIEGIQSESAFFYDMNYQAIMDNLGSSDRQLNMSDDIPGIYFFHSSSNKFWDETPFEFDKSIDVEFGNLPEPPVTRKKEKVEKVSFPTAPGPKESASKGKTKSKTTGRILKEERKEVRQPRYKLKHAIEFSNLDDVVFRPAGIQKRDMLDYYAQVAETMLPYIKDRPLPDLVTPFKFKRDQMPDWVRFVDNDGVQTPLCNDKEHLLLFVEMGCVEFRVCHSRIKSIESPDYVILAVGYDESDVSAAIDVMNGAREILDGVKIPSLVKTNPPSGFHIYIPLDGKHDFDVARNVAEYICKLIKLKLRDSIVVEGLDKRDYGKISVDYNLNEKGQTAIAPYSLAKEGTGIVATPLSWKELSTDFNPDIFTPEAILTRIKRSGDAFAAISKHKVNAAEVLKRLKASYSFLM